MNKLFGYFNSSEQKIPAYDPGLTVPCIICYKPLSKPMVTLSFMAMDVRQRSYFYRCHKACYESLSNEEISEIESSVIDKLYVAKPQNKDLL